MKYSSAMLRPPAMATALGCGSSQVSAPTSIFATLTAGDPFHPENVARLRLIGLMLAFPTLVDAKQAVGRLYDVEKLPLTLLVDADGIGALVFAGFTDAAAIVAASPLRVLMRLVSNRFTRRTNLPSARLSQKP